MTSEIFGKRYQVEQQLGKKAGRRTLLARDLTNNELVIIKLLSFTSDFEWDDLKLFEREAETLKALQHPHIPRYLDYFEVNSPQLKGFALVQSYIPAQTLEQQVQAGRKFTEIEVKQIAISLLEILVYLHQLSPPVIHRDIKPSNILLTNRSGNSVGEVYLVDFGSVQTVAASEGGTMTVVGTYGYMPLEQFGGRTVPASDLYSLGATLIYLVTGTHPADLPQKDFQIQFEQITNLSPAFTNWLKSMTQPSLERRLSSASQALQLLTENKLPETFAEVAATREIIAISKPIGSKIQLNKDKNNLEILIPPAGFQLGTAFIAVFALVWNFIMFGFWSSSNFSFWLLLLPHYWVGLYLIFAILFTVWGKIRLQINQQKIVLAYELWGYQYFHRSAPVQNIYRLVHTQRSFTRKRQEISPRLIIWVGVKKYEITNKLWGTDSSKITEAETYWLADELSAWLGIPITRE